MSRVLPDAGARSILIAGGLGAAFSSCSYAAVAMARSLVRKGADFTVAMAFQFAATNLVLELGVLLIVLLGWQFGVAEFIGGPIMIVLLVLTFRSTLKPTLQKTAIATANRRARLLFVKSVPCDLMSASMTVLCELPLHFCTAALIYRKVW